MTISDEELDELKGLLDKRRRYPSLWHETDTERLLDLLPRLLSHYRSARNDGLEDASVHIEAMLHKDGGPGEYENGYYIHRGWMRARDQALAIVRALKSPPLSEPGTEDVKT